MSKGKLKTAVLGLNDAGCSLLEAASKINYFQIQAVADKDTELAEKIAQKYNCTAYDDYRQLIIQNQFDCLFIAAGMYSCAEYIKMAMKKKFNILKLAPPARNFQEAAEFARLAEDEDIKFAIANPARFAPSFLAFRQYLKENQLDQIFLLSAVCNVGDKTHPAWQTDPKLAGGGVLLQNCYQIIDQIICNFSWPEQVYSLNTNTAADRQQRLCLTEDTAVVTMKFTDSFFAQLIASRTIVPAEQFLKLYSKNKILTVSKTLFTVTDNDGQVAEKIDYDDDQMDCMKKLLENFALSIVLPDKNKLYSSAVENLNNMAVIESAYLSARTAMPEEPAKILQLSHLEPTSIWPEYK